MAVHEARLGRYLEDFAVGDVFQHPLGRTITATDNAWFTLLTGNTNQLHFNDHYAAQTAIGRPLVNSGLTVAMVLGLSVVDISQNAIANLEWHDIKLLQPVFVGDTLYAESIVLKVRESASRPYAGVVTVGTRGLKQDGTVCLTYTRSVMVYKRGADPAHFPVATTGIGDAFGGQLPGSGS
jgi:itaconyl-CoA hydratase